MRYRVRRAADPHMGELRNVSQNCVLSNGTWPVDGFMRSCRPTTGRPPLAQIFASRPCSTSCITCMCVSLCVYACLRACVRGTLEGPQGPKPSPASPATIPQTRSLLSFARDPIQSCARAGHRRCGNRASSGAMGLAEALAPSGPTPSSQACGVGRRRVRGTEEIYGAGVWKTWRAGALIGPLLDKSRWGICLNGLTPPLGRAMTAV